jgi:hypothetical protein
MEDKVLFSLRFHHQESTSREERLRAVRNYGVALKDPLDGLVGAEAPVRARERSLEGSLGSHKKGPRPRRLTRRRPSRPRPTFCTDLPPEGDAVGGVIGDTDAMTADRNTAAWRRVPRRKPPKAKGGGSGVPRLQRARARRTRTAAAIAVTALPGILGLAAFGCGQPAAATVPGRAIGLQLSSGSSGGPGSRSPGSFIRQELAFSQCMRRHGLPKWPDPNSNGTFPPSAKQVAASNPSRFQDARSACSHLLPNAGNGPTEAQWQQILTTMVKFARCMRHHGVPNWPDPAYDTHGRPVFDVNVDPNSPQFSREIHACQNLLHNYGSRPGWPDLSNYFQYTR